MFKSSVLFVIACLTLASAYATPANTGKINTLGELQGYLLNHKADFGQFRLRGPFAVDVQKDYTVRLSATERINTDLFLSAPSEKAPLVIIVHGHDNSKEAHTLQGMHLASWGMHTLVLQLPRKGPWVKNGKTLVRIVNAIVRRPEIINSRIDVKKIILAGHSFGGAAVAIALAERVPVAGGILLDPAVVIRDFPAVLRKINTPVMLLGADEQISSARNRSYFYRYIPRGIAEISIKGAAHEDAQYAEYSPNPDESQVAFVSALVSAAFSLSSTGKLDYAWASFGDGFKNGMFFNVKRK